MTVLDYRSVIPSDSDLPTPRGHWLLWANYLAMSWTWCIGMFLPVLLVRDYGIWGWVVFALPNVIGAAAMGWMLRASQSAHLVRAHAESCRTFSVVTIAFHAFFGLWIILPLLGMVPTLLLGSLALGSTLITRDRTPLLCVAAVALFVSTGLFALGVATRELPYVRPGGSPMPVTELQFLAPVMLFGFALCPYLDLTFHHARAHLSVTGARAAFTIGFSTLFVSMIVFTLAYSGWMSKFSPGSEGEVPPFVGLLIGTHLIVQSMFTTGLHMRESWRNPTAIVLLVAIAVCLVTFAARPHLIFGSSRLDARNTNGEQIYRFFMGFYGLVFPAYVWLCMIPSPYNKPSRRSLVVFAISVLIAAPMFWMGFILGKMIWLLPGLAIVLLARLLVPRVRAVPSSGGDSAASDATR